MAWLEAAAVYYLRTLTDRIEPHQRNPLPIATGLGEVELVRELATLLMLFAVGWLAGTTARRRFGYALIAFGIWDIFYYVFLKVMTGWPQTLADWDVLFLIPLPWWGPIWAPVSIALLMILWGTSVTQVQGPAIPRASEGKTLALGALGVVLALYVFMADAIRVADQGTAALRAILPVGFNWPLFTMALMFMAVPVVDSGRHAWRKPNVRETRED
ncbi:MAG TPA: hypothetical protein VFA77_03310 [Candidatus Eisenbacteria bacterium]|jgi:hypothetical protein|nr:hypothetical protein [Candidatus Eisenbacteria bacterium]